MVTVDGPGVGEPVAGTLDVLGVGVGTGICAGLGSGNPPSADLRTQLVHGMFHRPPEPFPGAAVSPKVFV